MRIYLVDQREVVVPALPGDLVDADGAHPVEAHVGSTPCDSHFHGTKHAVPRTAEHLGHFLPAQAPRPAGEKPGIGVGQLMFAGGPRHALDLHAAARAVHAPRCIQQKHLDPPQRHELEAALRQAVISRARRLATRAPCTAVASFAHQDFQLWPRGAACPAYRRIHKAFEFLHAIEDSRQLHPGSRSVTSVWLAPAFSQSRGRDASLCGRRDGAATYPVCRRANQSWRSIFVFRFSAANCCCAVELVDSRRPVGKRWQTRSVFHGLSTGERECAQAGIGAADCPQIHGFNPQILRKSPERLHYRMSNMEETTW